MIVIQERDRKILKLCFEQQFILTEHAEIYFSSYQACRKRIQELVKSFYLREELTGAIGRKPLYRVTRLGAAVAMESGAAPLSQSRGLSVATLSHDAIVTSVRQRLESFWDGRFICERAIKGNEYRQIPDGIFFFPGGKGIAIEVENSDKGRARFLRLLGRWNDVRQIILILYVATTDALHSSLQKYLMAAPKEQPVGLLHFHELQQGSPPIWTPRGELRLLERRTF